MGIEITTNLGKFLGASIIHKCKSKALYGYILNNIKKRLAGWKQKCLSIVGRCTLIQTTLSTVPLHTMQSMLLLTSTCAEIDKASRTFLWGDDDITHKNSPSVLGRGLYPQKGGRIGIANG
ncbi:unnamed protein product [Cuscuta europaea]|uniref:Uncharacterized protein n=1 Tax=Cuscuta europaea TaxID=41803 RepID=A0A9P1EN54_CUSEU|nr:unnamed protein product [Cuscuta europaea]